MTNRLTDTPKKVDLVIGNIYPLQSGCMVTLLSTSATKAIVTSNLTGSIFPIDINSIKTD